ncbi:MAG: hypothetical protein EXS25_08670 [Pedosphaera sp.]|nr:hypothetical protein [Pedosphaera sp.]
MVIPNHTHVLTRSHRRLLAFVLGLIVFAGLVELGVRCNVLLFSAASHRALAKVAMFERHSRVDILFLGTSRTQDGVSPALIAEAVTKFSPALGEIRGYNAAFTSSSLDALEALGSRFLSKPELKLVVIELSDPQQRNPATPWNGDVVKASPSTLEGRLIQWAQKIYCVKQRSAFVSDNITRLPALLLFAPSLGGWEVKGSDQLTVWLGHREKPAEDFDFKAWQPVMLPSNASNQSLNTGAEQWVIADRFSQVASQYKARGIQVVFASPPLRHHPSLTSERASMEALFQAVSYRSQCEVWDFSSSKVADRFFRDPSHLNTEGRAHYSKALAVEITRLLSPR